MLSIPLAWLPWLGPVDFADAMLTRAAVSALLDNLADGNGPKDGRGSLHWIIVGGESGGGARPMHPDWARAIRDQCAAVGLPFFFKQWGEFAPHPSPMAGGAVYRVGKRRAGRLLDGVEHNAMPEARG